MFVQISVEGDGFSRRSHRARPPLLSPRSPTHTHTHTQQEIKQFIKPTFSQRRPCLDT